MSLLLLFALLCPLSGCSGDELTVNIPKIGAADSILLSTKEHAVMIDTGEEDDAEVLLYRLASAGISKLDLLILTHFDKDHIGSASAVIENIPVERILTPDYTCGTKLYRDMQNTISEKEIPCEALTSDLDISVGPMDFSVRTAKQSEYENNDNDHSLVIFLNYGEKRLCFAGDAEAERIAELLADGGLACDVLKMPHHGRLSDNSEKLISACAPEYAIITDSDKSPADPAILNLLSAQETECFQTRFGDVRVVTNGRFLAVHQDE